MNNNFLTRKYLKLLGKSISDVDNYYIRLKNLRNEIHPNLILEDIVSEESYIHCNDGTPIFYQKWIPEKPEGLFLCQHGNSVHGDLFIPFADEVVPQNWAVISIDNRGHGRSGPTRGNLDKRLEMNLIYAKFIKKWRNDYPKKPIIFYGESLGCTLVKMYLHSDLGKLYPPDGIIFQVPPYRMQVTAVNALIKIYPLVIFTLYPLFRILELVSFKRRLIEKRFYEPIDLYLDSFRVYDELDPLVNDSIYIGNYKSLALLIASFHHKIERIYLPILILEGTKDSILDPQGAILLYNKILSKKKKLIMYNNAEHSLFMAKGSQNIYSDVLVWVKKVFRSNSE